LPQTETLLCTVRECRLPLLRDGSRFLCGRGHSFDAARSGYVNLLQPQDKRSKKPGDTAAAVAGRRRLHDRGVTAPLLAAVAELLGARAEDSILDAGCGEGFYMGSIARATGCAGHGVDIATAAVDAAARRYPECQWVAANADRFVPWADGAFSAVMSITARMNPAEFRRVLRADGRLLVAVPAPDDLIELRGQGRERTQRTIEEFAPHFALAEQRRASTTAELDAAAVDDVLHSIYRPMRGETAPADAERAMPLTFSLDLLLFRPVIS